MLRKKLGDEKVVVFICNHGLAQLFDGMRRNKMTKEMLQSTLDEGMQWYAALLRSFIQYEADPSLNERRELGA